MVLETHMKLYMTDPDFAEQKKKIKNKENGPKMGQKHGFLNLLKTFVFNFY